jgi:VWFA-related protein
VTRTTQPPGPRTWAALLVTVALAASHGPTYADQPPSFRGAVDLVSVDVIVRDRTGAIVRGLTPEDFEIREDGRVQEVLSFTFEDITDGVAPVLRTDGIRILADLEPDGTAPLTPIDLTSASDLAGRRLIVLLFDVSSMQPEEVQRAVESGERYVAEQMSAADLVAVATVASELTVLTDFTSDRAAVAEALRALSYAEGTAVAPAEAATAATDEDAATADVSAEVSEFEMFNNDVRLRLLRALAESLAPIDQKKAILYFSSGMQQRGQDNQVELRAATNAANRANVSIYPIDSRGLQAIVPGGDASQASGRGVALFSGRGVAQQFARLAASQDTLTSLAEDTGGRAFTDTNDFGAAFSRVQRDLSAYYLLGYSSTNPLKDGRFRRIQVRVKRDDLQVEARRGYYAETDFAHTSRTSREAQLEEQLYAALSSTDLPVVVSGGWFRLTPERYYVPVALAVPGAAVPVPPGKKPDDKITLDVLGIVSDEQGRPVGRIRETLQLPAGTGPTLAGMQVLYQSGVVLPPGRFGVKVVVRENTHGAIGSFETALVVPELKQAPVKISSPVLGTQLLPASGRRTDNPLVRDGMQLLPNLTRVVDAGERLYFYYEVYDAASDAAGVEVETSLTFYRNGVKVYETPAVSRARVDNQDRHAAIFQFEVPAGSLSPGLYTCQITVIDRVAGQFAFPRVEFFVRPPA